MLEIQKFLIDGGTFSELEEKHGIKSVQSKKNPELYLFKYGQINSNPGLKIVQECRGIILNKDNDWSIVSRGFDRFYNYGDVNAANIDWSTARCLEKIDGSLIVLYEYKGQWNISTSGSPDASGEVYGHHEDFAGLFINTYVNQLPEHMINNITGFQNQEEFNKIKLPELNDRNKDFCYIFELTTPYNKVVVQHHSSKVTLLAVRDRLTGLYVDEHLANVSDVREFSLGNIQDIIKSFETIDGSKQEGFVVVDGNDNRIKIKHPQYIALHHMRDNLGPKWFVSAVCNGEIDEIVNGFPEYKQDLDAIKTKYDTLIKEIKDVYASNQRIKEQKEFALAVKDKYYSAVLFGLRSGKIANVKDWFAEEKNLNTVCKFFDIKES